MEIVGFMHIYAVNDYEHIVNHQIDLMKESGLYDEMSRVYYGVVGNGYWINDPKFIKLYCTLDMQESEVATINCIKNYCSYLQCRVFYVHTKGVTKPHFPLYQSYRDWRTYMEYFIIEQYKICLQELESADVVGVNWHYGAGWRGAARAAGPHFSGNFWWANSNYLTTLPELNEETSLYKDYPGVELPTRWDAEFWIGRGKPIAVELWNSGVQHSRRIYAEKKYRGKQIIPRRV